MSANTACRLYSSADETYLRRFGIAFAMAAGQRGWGLHLSAIPEGGNENRLMGLLELMSQAYTVICNNTAAMSWSIDPPWRHWVDDEERRVVLACNRFFSAGAELKRQPGSLLITDVDALVNQPPDAAPNPHGIGIYIRDPACNIEQHDWLRIGTAVNAGLVHIPNNADGNLFLKTVQATIQSMPLRWYVDQAALLMSHQALTGKIKSYPLNDTHLGWEDNKNCLLWSAKGNRKTSNITYLKRKKRLMNKFGRALAQL